MKFNKPPASIDYNELPKHKTGLLNFYSVKPNIPKIVSTNKHNGLSFNISAEHKENIHKNKKNSDSLMMDFDDLEREHKSN